MIDTVEPEKVIDTSPAKKHRENYENRTKHAGLALFSIFITKYCVAGRYFCAFHAKLLRTRSRITARREVFLGWELQESFAM